MFLLYRWDLVETETAQFESADIGASLFIEAPLVPLVFLYDEKYALFAFTSEASVPKDYLEQGYAVAECDAAQILLEMQAVEALLGQEPLLVCDPFDGTCKVFAKSQVQAMLE